MQPSGSIKQWDEQERPREKLLERGVSALTDAEVLALLIGSGKRDKSAVEVGRDLIAHFGSLRALAAASVQELTHVPGIGPAKSITLVAAFDLARRKQREVQHNVKLDHPHLVADYVRPLLADLAHEVFYLLMLNNRQTVVAEKSLFSGGLTASIVDIRLVFREALKHAATRIIVCHNHPSGSLDPSEADRQLTRQLLQAGRMLEIPLMDHVIITHDGHYSFADHGALE